MSEPTAGQRNIIELLKKRGSGTDVSRVTIRETEDGLGIHNPTHRLMPVILFLLLWLGGWSVGEYFVLNEIFRSGFGAIDLFLFVWVTFWTLGGLAAWWVVLWQLFGVEQLFITGGAVVHEIGLWRVRRRRVHPLDRVGRFELAERAGNRSSNRAISFMVDGKQHGFGIGLSTEEARTALAAINRHLPKAARAAAADESAAPSEGR